MIFGLHHPAISTPDLQRAVSFYCDAMGGELVKRGRLPPGNQALNERLGLDDVEAETAIIRVGHSFIEFFEFSTPLPAPRDTARPAHAYGLSHLCFQVDDCAAEYHRLSLTGIRFHAPPMVMPTGATFTYGRDPDGNIFELIEIPTSADFPTNYKENAG